MATTTRAMATTTRPGNRAPKDGERLLGNAAGHKPGYAFSTRVNDDLQRAYAEYDQRASEAWRSPSSSPLVATNDREMTLDEIYRQRELEDSNAWRGPGNTVAPAVARPTMTRDQAQAVKGEAYRLYDLEQENAWRLPHNVRGDR